MVEEQALAKLERALRVNTEDVGQLERKVSSLELERSEGQHELDHLR